MKGVGGGGRGMEGTCRISGAFGKRLVHGPSQLEVLGSNPRGVLGIFVRYPFYPSISKDFKLFQW